MTVNHLQVRMKKVSALCASVWKVSCVSGSCLLLVMWSIRHPLPMDESKWVRVSLEHFVPFGYTLSFYFFFFKSPLFTRLFLGLIHLQAALATRRLPFRSHSVIKCAPLCGSSSAVLASLLLFPFPCSHHTIQACPLGEIIGDSLSVWGPQWPGL